MYIVASGRLIVEHADGSELRIVGKGELFGELNTLGIDMLRCNTVRAISAVECFCVQKEDLVAIFADDMPEVLSVMKEWALKNAIRFCPPATQPPNSAAELEAFSNLSDSTHHADTDTQASPTRQCRMCVWTLQPGTIATQMRTALCPCSHVQVMRSALLLEGAVPS